MMINVDMMLKISGEDYFQMGKFDYAIRDLTKYYNQDKNDIDVLIMLAEAHFAKEQSDIAVRYYKKALAINPTDTSNLLRFSSLKLSAQNYIDVLKSSHRRMSPERYIEIGVCKGVSFGLASPNTIAIGIDPEPQLDIDSLPKKHIVVSDTSDNYFESGRIEKDFDGQPFDMAFLDGMHLFEFALRDFINLEKHSNSKSIVFVHDLYPMNAETATRERNSDFWSGDVWKLVLCLQEYRPDLGLEVLPCPPTGLGYITNLDSSSIILIDNYDEILEKYIDMPFEVIENDREKKLLLAGVDHPMLVSA